MTTFRKEEVESLRRSGTDEEYTELDQLLEELDELERDARAQSEAEKDLNKKKVNNIACQALLKYGHSLHSLILTG